MKKRVSIMLTFILLFSSVGMISVNAIAYGEKIAGGFYYTVIENKYAVVTGVEESSFNEVIEIPAEINGYTVKYIDDYFSIGMDAEYINEIIIPDTVTYIGESAFAFDSGDDYDDMISGVKTIVLPSNLTYIGEGAFRFNTKLKEINIPETVTYIGSRAFSGCDSLEEVYIPGTARVIGRSVFAGCDNLREVTLGEGLESIPKYAFESCKRLEKVNLPNSTIRISKYAFYNCTSLESVTVKDNTSIGENAFGFYVNNKGKKAHKKGFKLKVYETQTRTLDNEPLFYANLNGFESVYNLVASNYSKMTCDLRNSKLSKLKAKLIIKGTEVKMWSSSNPKVAVITTQGKLKTTGKGTTTLTAKLKDGSVYSRKLKVRV